MILMNTPSSYLELVSLVLGSESPSMKIRTNLVELWSLSRPGSSERDLVTKIVSRFENQKLALSRSQLKLVNERLEQLRWKDST